MKYWLQYHHPLGSVVRIFQASHSRVSLFNMSFQDIIEPEKVEEVLLSHLKENKIFLKGPKPWTIRSSLLGGRGMFATRDIKQNELIFIDSPLLVGPKYIGKYFEMCVSCYKNECALFPCDRGCGLPVCSTQCENSPKHVNYECEYLKSLVPTCGTDWSPNLLLAVVPIRALFLTEQQRKCLATLQSDKNLTCYPEIEQLKKNVTNSPSEEDMELMKHVCRILNTNSFETIMVHDKEHSVSLRGLYSIASFQNHCCVPNTRHHFDGEFRMYVSAALPIAAGEEITSTYTSLFWDTTLRRKFLSITKHFSCMCKRCSDPTEFKSRLGALLCASDKCSGELLPLDPLNMTTPWICNKCAITLNHRQICSIRSGIAGIIKEVLCKTPREIYKFLQKELSLLTPWSNYCIVDMKFRIVSYYGRSDGAKWEDLSDTELNLKAKFCNDLLSVLDDLNCGDCRKRGLILYELYCTNLEKIKRFKQQPNIEEVDENQRILEKAITILQNDIISAVTFEHDKNYFKQPITV
ncbi:SET domain-containing protein SmydA-8-like [Bombus vosnesenskii]|uniref:SET domain-containing protein SmydA-8-like n=1 Tax=Bombus vosnesenskii TaxID=207650 RepID=A0A6J3LEK7_9HYME|nr:SET domain-containing protein SmydA-8-like [Bombus vosnesenskii]